MATSANVTYYTVYRGEEIILKTSQHCLCVNKVEGELAEISKPEECRLVLRWPDEDEVNWYSKPINLKDYFDGKQIDWEDDE